MVSFETMIMMMNEGMHKEGVLAPEKYITGTQFISLIIVWCIVLVLFDYFYFSEKNNVKRVARLNDEEYVFLMIGWEYVLLSQYMLHLHKYEDLLIMHGIFVPFVYVMIAVATKKEFEEVRRFIEEKFGWLF